ncbi:uncharacterized protein JN550_013011 [Neoarthrinium moseri]|uniref:uncharacterized protein n=1 Tax=Neoarthrinium moseri TaxID=1658444 RepID=UPI001FDC8C61|nr:uncharacterized protein JN550_013011 [Neoarthrinium moseri]KAI1857813.1 hypothetical protein JN550_013011 [Neoarthrinium moseri]
MPYITKIVLREAKLAGNLNRVIVGGQGETAIAAHGAITSFPEMPDGLSAQSLDGQRFIDSALHSSSTELSQLRLGGFVGMHGQGDEATRDQRTLWLMSKFANKQKINDTIVLNTPHEFIHGGFKNPNSPGDGTRIDDFAAFLSSIGVPRTEKSPTVHRKVERKIGPLSAADTLDSQSAEVAARLKHELTEQEKHQQRLKKQKQADSEARERVRQKIEDDKLDRKDREERQRLNRGHITSKKDEDPKAMADQRNYSDYYAELVKKKKAAEDAITKETQERTRRYIEEDKIERKERQERERANRLAAEASQASDTSQVPTERPATVPQPANDGHNTRKRRKTAKRYRGQGLRLGGSGEQVSLNQGEMSETRMRALGLLDNESSDHDENGK